MVNITNPIHNVYTSVSYSTGKYFYECVREEIKATAESHSEVVVLTRIYNRLQEGNTTAKNFRNKIDSRIKRIIEKVLPAITEEFFSGSDAQMLEAAQIVANQMTEDCTKMIDNAKNAKAS